MGGPLVAPSGMDIATAELILTMPCTSGDETVQWFGLIQECHQSNENDFDAFAGSVRESASSFDQQGVTAFLEYAESTGGSSAVALMLEYSPDVYWELVASRDGETTDGADQLAWVDQTQADSLSAAWGTEWQQYLPEQLDARWGTGWQANPDEYKHAWLADLLPELLGTGDTEQSADDEFGWVRPDQSDRLAAAWGTEWQQYLPEQVEPRWGSDWATHPAEHKQAWLDDLLPELLGETADESTDSAEEDLDALARQLVESTIGEVEGADALTDEQLAEAIAAVRKNLEG